MSVSNAQLIIAATAEQPLTVDGIAAATGLPIGVVKNAVGGLQRDGRLVNVDWRPARYSSNPGHLKDGPRPPRDARKWDFAALLAAWRPR